MRLWLVVAAVAACGKNGGGSAKSGSGTQAAAKAGSDTTPAGSDVAAAKPAETKPAGKPTVPWKLDEAAVLGKLDGTWIVRGFGSSGAVEAWKLEHGDVTIFDPSTKQ